MTGGNGGIGGTVTIGTPMEPGDPGAADVTFTIRTDMDVHPISPLIYGWNGADAIAERRADGHAGRRQPLDRLQLGEQRVERRLRLHVPERQLPGHVDGARATRVKATLDAAKTKSIAALITVPIVDYVSADTSPGGDVPRKLMAATRT